MLILKTKRLIIRDYVMSDVNDLVKGLNNLSVSKWLSTVPYPYKKSDAESFIKYAINESNKKLRDNYELAITINNKVIGGVSLKNINRKKGTAGGGIWLNEEYHGKGYGFEAFKERTRFAFQDLGLKKILNGFFEGNKNSWRMQRKLGYKIIGERELKCLAEKTIKKEILTELSRSNFLSAFL